MEVFTSVSNGKKQVASDITDKGVTTESEATFLVMHDNILTLVTQQYQTGYADGLAAINNASIMYEKHHHTGNAVNGGPDTGGTSKVHNSAVPTSYNKVLLG